MAKKYTDEEQNLRDSLTGSAYDKQYFTTEELQSAADIVKSAQEGKTDWDSAHDYVENIRKGYGYSGGATGSEYNKINVTTDGKYQPGYVQSYGQLPSYISQNQEAIDNALNSILNREAFNYDYTQDPRWQAYKKEYTREGQRATADALGQYAAATGGMPSTAAMTAATQAGDYYSAKMTDKIPELYNLAYSMYQDEGNNLRNNLAALMDIENMDYGKFRDQLDQYNANRAFDYDAWYNDKNYDYQTDRDAINDSRYDTEWNYQIGRDAQGDALSRVQDYLAAGGSASALDPELISQSGLTPAELSAYESYYKQQAALATKSGRGSGGRSGSGAGDALEFDNDTDRMNAFFEEASKQEIPENWIASHYKEYGFTSSSGLSSAYKNWMKDNSYQYGEGLSTRGFNELLRGISQNLQSGNVSGVEDSLNNVEGQVSEEQWEKIVEMLDNFGLSAK